MNAVIGWVSLVGLLLLGAYTVRRSLRSRREAARDAQRWVQPPHRPPDGDDAGRANGHGGGAAG